MSTLRFSWQKIWEECHPPGLWRPNRGIATLEDLCLAGIIRKEGSYSKINGEIRFSTQTPDQEKPYPGEPIAVLTSMSSEYREKLGVFGDVGFPTGMVFVTVVGEEKPGGRGWEILFKKRSHLHKVLPALRRNPVEKTRWIMEAVDNGVRRVSDIWDSMTTSREFKVARSSFDSYVHGLFRAGFLDKYYDAEGCLCVKRHTEYP